MLAKDKLQEVIRAKEAIANGGLTLWNIRLESMVSAGDRRAVDELLARPIENVPVNIGCNIGCNPLCGLTGGTGSW